MTDYQMVEMYEAMRDVGIKITRASTLTTDLLVSFNGKIVSGRIDEFREAVLYADAFLNGVRHANENMKDRIMRNIY